MFLWSWGFLRCVQRIKTLFLSYPKLFLDNFSKFFIIKGVGGLQKLPDKEKKVEKIVWKKFLTRGQTGTRKWVVEGFVIICGAFMDTLLHCTSIHCTALWYFTLYFTVILCTIFHCLRCTVPNCTTRNCIALCYWALYCTLLLKIVLPCNNEHCTALCYCALYCTVLLCTVLP